MKDILAAVSANIPRYNEYLLRGFMTEQISGAAGFVETMFIQAVKLFGGIITYKEYRVVPPTERAEYELTRRKGCRVTFSDLILIKYIFIYDGREYPIPLYIPYLRNDVITIDDTVYVLQRSIKEQAFSRTANGITLKVLRQPIPFYRNIIFRLESVSEAWSRTESIPTTSIYNQTKKSSRGRMPSATIILYLLCKFGFVETLRRFDLTTEDCAFVNDIAFDTETFCYFAAKHVKKKQVADVFIKIRKTKLEDPRTSRLIASILYILTSPSFDRHQVESLYEPTGSVFRIMLGRIVNGSAAGNEIQSKNKIDPHISSLDSYLDPITKTRLENYGIVVSDIYDLLQYVFCKIDELIRIQHTDLYTTRIDYLEELLVDTIIKSVYLRWYEAIRRMGGGAEISPKKFDDKEVKKILNLPEMLIAKLSSSRVVQKSPPLYGDNVLAGWLIQKMRQSGLSASGKIIRSPDHRFHPSNVVVESILAFSKSNPGAAGSINPYLEIESNGKVIRPPFADEIDQLEKYLP